MDRIAPRLAEDMLAVAYRDDPHALSPASGTTYYCITRCGIEMAPGHAYHTLKYLYCTLKAMTGSRWVMNPPSAPNLGFNGARTDLQELPIDPTTRFNSIVDAR